MEQQILASLITAAANYGPPFARWLQKVWTKQTLPTDAEWDAAEVLVDRPGPSYFSPGAEPVERK